MYFHYQNSNSLNADLVLQSFGKIHNKYHSCAVFIHQWKWHYRYYSYLQNG